MKFVCMGYLDEAMWDATTPADQSTFMDECLAYDDVLQRGGHFVGGEALQAARNAVTLRYRQGQVAVTDGPFAETKEQLGGLLFLQARDLNHAIALMSKHPGVRCGPFEIRPVDEEFTAMVANRAAANRTCSPMQAPEPQQQHHWLQKMVGKWSGEYESRMSPEAPPSKSTGTEVVRSLGGRWVIAEGEGEMPGGGTWRTIMSLGYDAQQGQFVGTFIGSMMTNLWVYEGSLQGNKLTLDTEGPDFSGGPKLARYIDVIEFLSDDHRTLTSYLVHEDGKQQQFVVGHMRRQK